MDPVSNQAPPLPINSADNFLSFKYLFNKSTISISPLFDGLSCFANLQTFLSKKYKPVIAKSEINFLGFSFMFLIFLPITFAIPKFSGLFTLCNKTLAPFFNFVQLRRIFVKFCP